MTFRMRNKPSLTNIDRLKYVFFGKVAHIIRKIFVFFESKDELKFSDSKYLVNNFTNLFGTILPRSL